MAAGIIVGCISAALPVYKYGWAQREPGQSESISGKGSYVFEQGNL